MTLTADLVRERVRGTILGRIGETPLVPLRRIGAGLRGELWAKIESANPGGSVKDRPALWMVLDAEVEGRLVRRRVVLDATSGNTGVALADPLEGTDGAIREAQRRAAADPDRYVYVDQYSNPANPLAHELGTGTEI